MADQKISELAELTSLAADDEFVVVDKSDTTMAASGTDKKLAKSVLVSELGLTTVVANTQTDNYTLVLGDAGKAVEMNNASSKTITVPPNADVAFPVGTVVEVHRYGAGACAVAAGSGVTIRSPGSKLNLASQYSSASLRKRATNEWVLAGDLAT